MAAVADLGEYTIELAHALGQIAVGGLNEQVVVVAHEAIRIAKPIEALDHLRQRQQERASVVVVLKNGLTPVTACSDVVKRIGKFQAEWAGHDGVNIA